MTSPPQVASSTSKVIVRDGVPADALNPDVITGRSPRRGLAVFLPERHDAPVELQHPAVSARQLSGLGRLRRLQHTVRTESAANVNQPEPGAGPNNPRRWFPQFANINTNPTVGGANYQGLEAKFERRFSGGFSMLSGFTWSKTLAKQLGQRTSWWHLAPEKTVSRQHLPQRLFFAGVWDLPFGEGRQFATQGCPRQDHPADGRSLRSSRRSAACRSAPGSPATRPTRRAASGRTGSRTATCPGARGRRSGGLTSGPSRCPPASRSGNSAAWIIEGPGLVNLDVMISRTFALTEELSLDFPDRVLQRVQRSALQLPEWHDQSGGWRPHLLYDGSAARPARSSSG